MKYTTAILTFAAAVMAQPSTSVPSCANSCIDTATLGDKIAGCNQGDIKCICENNDFLDSIACCLEDKCDEEGKNQAVSFATAICSGAGVDVPDEVVCKESAASGTPSASDTSASGTSDDNNDPEETDDSDSDDEEEADSRGARAIPVVGGLAGGVLAAMALL